jgi:CubicO group peptidase (beta-lactamase class C family)
MNDAKAHPPKFFGTPPPRTQPFTLGEVNAALDELRDAARFATTAMHVPGLSIALVFRENGMFRLRHHEGFGVKHLGRAEGVGPDTLFPCASLSKPVSGTLIAAGKGKDATWDEVVKQRNGDPYHLAALPEPITLRDWLSHTSGLPDEAGDLMEVDPSISRDEIIRNVLEIQTGLEKGVYHYTNFGYTIGCLGAMHALSPSDDWESFSTAALRDLGMEHSTYRFTSAFGPGAGDRVVPHTRVPEGDGWRVNEDEERNPSQQAPAGSLISSGRDMVAFLEKHLDGRFGNYPPRGGAAEGKHVVYSLGWNVTDYSRETGFTNAINATSFSHSGAFLLGAATHVRVDPDAGVGVAILTNGEPVGVPEALAMIFFNHLYAQEGRSEFEADGKLDYGKVLGMFRAIVLAQLNASTVQPAATSSSSATETISG